MGLTRIRRPPKGPPHKTTEEVPAGSKATKKGDQTNLKPRVPVSLFIILQIASQVNSRHIPIPSVGDRSGWMTSSRSGISRTRGIPKGTGVYLFLNRVGESPTGARSSLRLGSRHRQDRKVGYQRINGGSRLTTLQPVTRLAVGMVPTGVKVEIPSATQ
jgi:hypothetical protein